MANITASVSIFVEGSTDPVGMVIGAIELPDVPAVGDSVSISFPVKQGAPKVRFPDFPGLLVVSSRIFQPSAVGEKHVPPSIIFQDIVVSRRQDGELLVEYFSKGFDLHLI
jgi:hypothetical protein